MAGRGARSGPRGKREEEGARAALVERYRKILVERLTPGDLRELKILLRNQFDARGNLDMAHKARFEGKLREFLHEEVLTREIIGIEALVRELRPGDLKK